MTGLVIPASVSGRMVTRRGVHLLPGGNHNTWMQNASYWLSLLVDMHMSWCLVLSDSDNVLISGAARALLEAGVIPIVRFAYKFPRHFTEMAATAQLVSLYDSYGAPCIVQIGNEPFDEREWVGDIPPYEEAWSIIADRWMEAARIVTGLGAIAGFPDRPGYTENPFLRIQGSWDLWESGQAAYLGHWYGKGRPVEYPRDYVSRLGVPLLSLESYQEQLDDFGDDPTWNEGSSVVELMNQRRSDWRNPDLTAVQDPTCWMGWQQIDAFAQAAFGHKVPMAMTEGGWVPRDRAGSRAIDIRWPYTTPRQVAQKTLMAFNYVDKYRPMFAMCPWLLADEDMGAGGWPFDAWVGWAYSALYGREKPVVRMLKENLPLEETET